MTVPWRKLGDIAQIYVGLPTKASETQRAGRSGNLLTVRSLTDTGIVPDHMVNLDLRDRDVERFRVRPDDVLVSARSTSLKTAVVPPDLDGSLINATLIRVRCLPALHPRLLVAWLNEAEGRAALEAVSQSGTFQMNITVAGLSKIEVPVPPLEAQSELVKLLDTADEAYASAIQAAQSRRAVVRQIVASEMKETRSR